MEDLLIGDAERDAALASLSTAFAAGKLTADELDERTALALHARTEADLAVPLAGLRRPNAEAPRPAKVVRATGPSAVVVAGWLLIALAVALIVGLGIAGLSTADVYSGSTFCTVDGHPTDC